MHGNASLSRPERDKETLCVRRGPLTKPRGLLSCCLEQREARVRVVLRSSSSSLSVGFGLVS